MYIVLFFICSMTMGAIPLIMVLLPVIFGIFGGLIFMVLLAIVACVAGCFWGRVLTRRQFSRAGIV